MELLDISISGRTIPKVAHPAPYKARNIPDVDTATPERLAMSDESTVTDDGARQFKDELLVRLADKGQLYPNATINAACKLAGEKYYADWYGSNMSALQAIDYGKVRSGQGGSGSHLPPGRIATKCREAYRAARAAMPDKYRKPVELILLEGQSDLVAIGKAITGSAVPATCRTVAIERFTFGLYLLAKHYVFLK
jgi:hypothetical protein